MTAANQKFFFGKKPCQKRLFRQRTEKVHPGAAAARGTGVGVAGCRSGCIIWEMDSMIQIEWLQCDFLGAPTLIHQTGFASNHLTRMNHAWLGVTGGNANLVIRQVETE